MTSLQTLHITGTQIAYYFICHKKLWLFTHGIRLEKEHPNVQLGKMLHKDRYKQKQKEILIDDTIKIDFVKTGKGVEIHEIKKTKSMESAHLYQILYYLKYLKERGVDASGVINYPKINKTKTVRLNSEKEKELDRITHEIRRIISSEIPETERKKICSKCAYLEFCFSPEGADQEENVGTVIRVDAGQDADGGKK